MTNYKLKTLISVPVAKVYEALTTQTGFQSWWTESCEVGSSVGEEIVVEFGNTYKKMIIKVLHPFEEVSWRVTDAKLDAPGLTRTDEWIGTTITFNLSPSSDSVTELQLEHVGLTPHIECYEICTGGWSQFIQSLKTYCETGKGTPFAESTA